MRSLFCLAPRVFVLVVVLSLAGASPASAQWTAMLAHAITNVQQAIGVWEKHQRIIEDQFMQVSGVLRPFSELSALYTSARGVLGVGSRRPILAHAYQAGFLNPGCFTTSARDLFNCEMTSMFQPHEFRTLRWNLHYVPQALPGGFEWREWERQVTGAWDVALEEFPPGPLSDAADAVPDILETRRRAQRAFYTSRWSARRMAAAVDTGRRASRQVLDRPGAPFTLRTSIMGGCPGGTPVTLLEAAFLADCATPGAPGTAGFESEGSQHLSTMEKEQLQIQASIVHTTLLASDLEKRILQEEEALRYVTTVRDVQREKQRKRLLMLEHGSGAGGAGCETFAYVAECLAGTVSVLSRAEEDALRAFLSQDS